MNEEVSGNQMRFPVTNWANGSKVLTAASKVVFNVAAVELKLKNNGAPVPVGELNAIVEVLLKLADVAPANTKRVPIAEAVTPKAAVLIANTNSSIAPGVDG